MTKTEMLALIGMLILGLSTGAQAITALAGDTLSPMRPNPYDNMPKWDANELPRLMELGDNAIIARERKAFKKQMERAGCKVEGFEFMDRTICPGFRADPKVAPEVSVQFFTSELHTDKVFPDRWAHPNGDYRKKEVKPTLPAGQI